MTPRCRMWLPDCPGRIKDLYNIPELAELFEYPRHREPGDGDAWDAEILGDVDLATVHLVVYVAMCSDATVLETWRQVSYTPLYLEILNWPPHVRATFEGMMLAALLPPSIKDYQVRVRV